VGQARRRRSSVGSLPAAAVGNTNGATSLAYGKANPYPARLLKNVLLNKTVSSKEVRHYEIALNGQRANL